MGVTDKIEKILEEDIGMFLSLLDNNPLSSSIIIDISLHIFYTKKEGFTRMNYFKNMGDMRYNCTLYKRKDNEFEIQEIAYST